MIITPAAPNSLDWLTARAGVLTASEFSELVDTKFEMRTGEMPKTLLARKLAERWLGGPLPGWTSIDMDIGTILEEEAIPFYTLETGQAIERVGLITTDDGRAGASPDGLIGEDGGIEIKCPRAETHVKNLLAGKIPSEYLAQVHGALWVTGRAWWKFMSYSRRMPALILTVQADREIQKRLGEAIEKFLAAMDVGWDRLLELNGGPPRRRGAQAAVGRGDQTWVSDLNDVPIP